jgi:hypothetical protein
MKLKHSILVDKRLYPIFSRLLKEPANHELRYKLRRIGTKIDQMQKDHLAHVTALVQRFGQLDEKGQPLLEYQGEGEERKAVGYKLKDPTSFESSMKEYLNSEFEIEVSPILSVDLRDVKLSVHEVMALEPFIADFDNV